MSSLRTDRRGTGTRDTRGYPILRRGISTFWKCWEGHIILLILSNIRYYYDLSVGSVGWFTLYYYYCLLCTIYYKRWEVQIVDHGVRCKDGSGRSLEESNVFYSMLQTIGNVICISLSVYVYNYVYISVYLSTSVYQSVFNYMSVCLSVFRYLSIRLYLYINQFISLSLYLATHPYHYQFVT